MQAYEYPYFTLAGRVTISCNQDMRIYIHAGMHKTGTTSIQSILASNAAKLAALNYRAIINPIQANAKNDKKFDRDWLQNQVAKARQDGINTLVISAEMISTFNREQISRLTHVFSGNEIIFILSLRHWAHFLPSRWATNCLRRDSQSFPAYFGALVNHQETHVEVAFDRIVEAISEAGQHELRIISYDNAIAGKGLLPVFFSAIGLPGNFGVTEGALPRQNKRLDHMDTELIRIFNGTYALKNGHVLNELFWGKLNGTGLTHKYDFKPKIINYLDKNPGIKTDIIQIICSKNIAFDLTHSNPNLSRWHQKLELVASPFLLNPIDGKLFVNVADNHFTCSKLEASGLEANLQAEMLKAWEPL